MLDEEYQSRFVQDMGALVSLLGGWSSVPAADTNLDRKEESERIPLPEELVRRFPHRDPHADSKEALAPLYGDWSFANVSHWPTPEFSIKVLSKSPRIFQINNFISADEAELIIRVGYGKFDSSMASLVTDDIDGELNKTVRNNEQYWPSTEDEIFEPVLVHVNRRAHRLARIPYEDSETIQLGHYAKGGKYEPHSDSDPSGAIRPATLLMYLQPALKGGHTIFFTGPDYFPPCAEEAVQKCCDNPPEDSILVKGEVGMAILFYTHDEAGATQTLLHAACPVDEGVKYVAQKWFRFRPYGLIDYPLDPSVDGPPTRFRIDDKEWKDHTDVRVISPNAPRIYYCQKILSSELVNRIRHEKMNASSFIWEKFIEPALDTAARIFGGISEYYKIPDGREIRKTDSIAEIIVLIEGSGSIIFPTNAEEEEQCRFNGTGCCLPKNVGMQVPLMGYGDGILWYPAGTADEQGSLQFDPYSSHFALCGDMEIIRHTYKKISVKS